MSAGPVVLDRDGRPGTLDSSEADASGTLVIRLPSGVRLRLPSHLVTAKPDGTYRADLSFAEVTTSDASGAVIVPEVEERIRVGRRVRETGRVRVSTQTETETQTVDEPAWRETIEVERVPVGEVVDAQRAPWEEGDVTVVPVYEEVLVVEKRLVLREEIRLTRRRETTHEPHAVDLRRQRVEIERLPPAPEA